MIFHRITHQPTLFLPLIVIITVVVVAVLGPVIRPDQSAFAGRQNRSIAKLPPLSKVKFLKVVRNFTHHHAHDDKRVDPEEGFRFYPYDTIEIRENDVVITHRGIQSSFHMIDIMYPLSRETMTEIFKSDKEVLRFHTLEGDQVTTSRDELEAEVVESALINRVFLLGTDDQGRDMMSRLMAGSAISLGIGFTAVIVALFLGLLIGILAGYFGGWVEAIITWNLNLFWSIPAILLVIAITLVIENGTTALIVGISLVLWVETAQVIAHAVRTVRNKEFIKVSRLMGLAHSTIILRHIIPNIYGPIAVMASSIFADALVLESGLSFLGIGVAPPQPSWGNMIREYHGYFLAGEHAHLALAPSILLVAVIASFVFITNGLRTLTDTRPEEIPKTIQGG